MKRFIALCLVLVLALSLCACGTNNETPNDNPSTDNQSAVENNKTDAQTKGDYSTYTKDYPTADRNIDYYWNIDTSGFDKTKFDGVFSLFGNDFTGKITGSTLQKNGYGLQIGSGLFTELLWDEGNNCYSDKSNGAYILKGDEKWGTAYLYNDNNETNLYSDNTEIQFVWNSIDTLYSETILPKCLISDMDTKVWKDLTVDTVIEKLGVPTYVEGRRNSSTENILSFNYIYVYDDFVLKFENVYNTNTGNSLTGFWYLGMNSYDKPCRYYDAEAGIFIDYNSPFEFLKKDQNTYLESIK